MAQQYVVKPGDTLGQIAAANGVSVSDISGYASGNPNIIKSGEVLSINPKTATPSTAGVPRNDLAANGGAGYQDIATKDPSVFKAPANTPDPQRPGETTAQYQARILQTPFLYRDPTSATGFSNTNPATGTGNYVPTLSAEESAAVLKKYGISGTGSDFTGLTAAEAASKAQAKKQQLLGGLNAADPTSSFYQVTQLGNIKKATDALNSGISTVNNDPWKTGDDKTTSVKELLDRTTNGIASSYSDPQSFINDYQTNPQLSAILSDYIKAGGTVNDVSQRIAQNSGAAAPGGNNQDAATYLLNGANSGAGDNVYTAAADKYLSTDKSNSVQEINRLAKVPQDYIDLYYGTPEKQGVLQKIKTDAQTSIDNLNKAYGNSKQTTSDQFDYQVQKNTLQAQSDVADLEAKRLQQKNYLTEKLASIGALTTTGAAPAALSDLDARYDAAKSSAMQGLQNTNALLISKKTEALNTLDADLQTKIQTIKSSLSKSESDIDKDILTEKEASQKAINAELDAYNTKAKSAYTEFLNTSNKSAQQYIKDFLKTASGGMSSKTLDKYSTQFQDGIAKAAKPATAPKPFTSGSAKFTGDDLSGLEQGLNGTRGDDGYVDPAKYLAAYNQWLKLGGLSNDFISKFPPKNYVNPVNDTLPPQLRGKKPTTKKSSDRTL